MVRLEKLKAHRTKKGLSLSLRASLFKSRCEWAPSGANIGRLTLCTHSYASESRQQDKKLHASKLQIDLASFSIQLGP